MNTLPTVKHLTAADLAERWSCSHGWLANMRSAGTGPTWLKVGSRVLYRIEDVEDYERQGERGGAA